MSAPPRPLARVLSPARQRLLAHRAVPVLAALACLLLCAPSLGLGLLLDDLVHRLSLAGEAQHLPGLPPGPLDLFRFMPGGAAFNEAAQQAGTLPWWTAPELRLAFLRPLAAASHWLDYELWPNNLPLMHAHSLAWMAALVLVVARVYRRFGAQPSAWVAGLATLLFALFSGHGVPASWVANRSALMAALFGVLALACHDRARREGWAWPRLLGPLCYALALACSEGALATMAYLGAYALVLDHEGRRGDRFEALLALAPYLALTLLWRALYVAGDYGASGSLMYVDPLGAPEQFALAALERLPLLALKLCGGPPSHLTGLAPQLGQQLSSAVSALLLALVLRALFPALREDRELRFWALGALLCCVPACATMPHDRLLTFAALGSSMMVAHVIARAIEHADAPAKLRRLAGAWLVLLLGVGPALLLVDGLSLRLIAAPSRAAGGSVPEEAAGKTLVVLNTPEPLSMCAQLPVFLVATGGPEPERLRCLGATQDAVELSRPNPETLILRVEGGYLRGPNSGLLVGPGANFDGFRRELEDLRVEVMRTTEDGRPEVVSFVFAGGLEDPERVWITWTGQGFERFELPEVGETALLEAHALDELEL